MQNYQVNDVDAVTIGEDVTTHFWVPATGLVAKVHTSVEELAHGYNCHVSLAFSFGFVLVIVRFCRTLAAKLSQSTPVKGPRR